jgi:non-canonical purine NTP pyrophosphatase (RdgB/HAM1 family)
MSDTASPATPFVFVTGNADKAAEARRIVGAELAVESVDLPEIQSLDPLDVARAKAHEAFARVGRAIAIEETSLELPALGGFPGPLVKWMLEAAGAEGIARCGHALGDPRALARCLVIVFDGRREVVGVGLDPGRLVLPARGSSGFGWDFVFAPDGCERTYAELGPEEKDARGHRGRAWRDLLAKLASAR